MFIIKKIREKWSSWKSPDKSSNLEINVKEDIKVHGFVRLKDKTKGFKKSLRETSAGDDYHRKSKQWNLLDRVIDRQHDQYKEVIKNKEGVVIHKCEEPLSNHRGHGSAKKKKYKIKVYLDNMVVCAITKHDLAPEEQKALDKLQKDPYRTMLVTSRQSWREQEKTKKQNDRDQFNKNRSKIPVVLNDHKVLGFSSQDDQYRGFITSPLVTDIPDEKIWNGLKGLFNDKNDAHHLMYALHNKCEYFATTDPHFTEIRNEIKKIFPEIQIVKPSELLKELDK